MRSIAARLLVVIVLSLTLAGGIVAATRGAEGSALESGALGLTRAEIEANWGPGSGPFDGPGHYFDTYELYSHPAQNATFHVAYQELSGGDQVAVYVEVAWGGNGATEEASRTIVEDSIPADAQLTDIYTAPPTADGPIAFTTYRYTSDSLNATSDGALASEILVTFHEAWGDPAVPDSTRVSAISIAIRERTQSTP